MSKPALDALIKSIRDYEQFKKTIRIEEDAALGLLGRKAGYASAQIFKVDKVYLTAELTKMIKSSAGLKLDKVNPGTISNIVDKVYDNILAYIQKHNFEYSEEEKGWLITGNKDNYQQVANALAGAFGSDTTFIPFFDFVIDALSKEEQDYTEEIKQVKDIKSGMIANPTKAKLWKLDAGHILSNIKDVFQIICFNSIRSSESRSKVFTKKTAKELEKLRQEWLKILNNEVASKALFDGMVKSGYIIAEKNYKDIIEEFFNLTLTFSRDISSGKIHGHIKKERKIKNLSDFTKLTKLVPKYLMPEWAYTNQVEKAQIEQAVMRHLNILSNRANTKLISFFTRWLSGQKIPGLDLPDLANFPGSPTINEMIGDNIYENLTKGRGLNKKYTTTTSKKATAKIGNSNKSLLKVEKAAKVPLSKKPVPTVTPIKRNTKSLNLVNVVNIINYKLADRIRQNMGSPRLNYRTGRFASSANVLPASIDRDGVLRLPYTYMKYPYQTFEIGYAKGDAKRDPRVVISESIRELATKIVLMRMRVVRV